GKTTRYAVNGSSANPMSSHSHLRSTVFARGGTEIGVALAPPPEGLRPRRSRLASARTGLVEGLVEIAIAITPCCEIRPLAGWALPGTSDHAGNVARPARLGRRPPRDRGPGPGGPGLAVLVPGRGAGRVLQPARGNRLPRLPGRSLGRRRGRDFVGDLGQPLQPAGQVPVPPAEQLHRGGQQAGPDDG